MPRGTDSAPESILVVDDAPATREVLSRNLEAEGYEVVAACGVREAVAILDARPIDVVITDLRMPVIGGMDLVRHVRENLKHTIALMITGYPSVEGAVQAIKAGAEDFLPKPFTDEELLRAVRGAFDKLHARRALEGQAPSPRPGLVGESEPMRRVVRALAAAVRVQAPTLIVGELGTGKDLVARTIHYSGPRRDGPFVPVHLASIPAEQARSEIFGERAGSPGFWGAATGGTLYFDGIEFAPHDVQILLARRLRGSAEIEDEVRGRDRRQTCPRTCGPNTSNEGRQKLVSADPLREGGASGPRILASASGPLGPWVKRGAFREELLTELQPGQIDLPPLRERGNDIVLLVQHFAAQAAARWGLPPPRISDEALQALRAYSWPGNVAELRGVVERLATGPGGLDVTDLPALMRFSVLRAAPLQTLAELEQAHIERVLAAADGNRSRAAEILGIDRKTLREKMKRAAGPNASEPDQVAR